MSEDLRNRFEVITDYVFDDTPDPKTGEKKHEYYCIRDGVKCVAKSATGILHFHKIGDTDWNAIKDLEPVKKARDFGTRIHKQVEEHYTLGKPAIDFEAKWVISTFDNLINKLGDEYGTHNNERSFFIKYTHDDKSLYIAGTLDFMFITKNGNISICDIKTGSPSKETEMWQLGGFYNNMASLVYDKKVEDTFIVNSKQNIIYKVPQISLETLCTLLDCELNQTPYKDVMLKQDDIARAYDDVRKAKDELERFYEETHLLDLKAKESILSDNFKNAKIALVQPMLTRNVDKFKFLDGTSISVSQKNELSIDLDSFERLYKESFDKWQNFKKTEFKNDLEQFKDLHPKEYLDMSRFFDSKEKEPSIRLTFPKEEKEKPKEVEIDVSM